MADMPLSEVIRTSLEAIKKVLDANTVVGEPMTVLDDTVIIPISKIAIGFASAGAEYGGEKSSENEKKEAKTKNFGGGGGTGVTLTPVSFLVVRRDGEVRMLNVDANSGYTGNDGYVGIVNAIDELINKAPGMVDRVKGMFGKKGDKDGKDGKDDKDPSEDDGK